MRMTGFLLSGLEPTKQNRKLFEQAQQQLGISKVNKPSEAKRITDLIAGFREAQKSPTLQAVGQSLGITKFNSINDYMRIQGQLSAPKPAAPAPAAPPPAPEPVAPAPSPDLERYRAEAQNYMQQADAILNQFRIDQSKAEEARKLQEQMFIQSQATAAANMARSQMAPNLQIQPASGTPETAGTQGFKRRQNLFPMAAKGLSSLNIQTPSTLNV